MHEGHEIVTSRLRLRLLEPGDIAALLDGRPVPGLRWARDYPLDGSLVAAAMQARLRQEGADVGAFGQYQVLRDGVVIGDIGFHTPPDIRGGVSLGFGICPSHRGNGYATEALRGLLGWALDQPQVRSIHADTDLVNIASQHVLANAGMRLAHDGEDRKVFEISASERLRA